MDRAALPPYAPYNHLPSLVDAADGDGACLPGEMRLHYVRRPAAVGSKQGGFPRSLAEGETRPHERRKPKRVAGAKRRRDADWYASADEDACSHPNPDPNPSPNPNPNPNTNPTPTPKPLPLSSP